MKTVNIHEAKTHLSRLLARVARGEEIVIAKAGKPIARLVPAGPTPGQRALGIDRERAAIADDFDAPCRRMSSPTSRSEDPSRHAVLALDAHRPRALLSRRPGARHGA